MLPEENKEDELEVEIEEEGAAAAVVRPDPSKDPDNETVGGEETVTDDDDDELEEYSQGVKKRIGKLTANWREAQRREQAAIDYAAAVKARADELEKQIKSLDGSYVTEFENRLKIAKGAANAKLRAAIDAANTDLQVEAQNEIAALAQEEAQLAIVKTRQTAAAAAAAAAPTKEKEQEAPAQRQVDPRAVAWAKKNSWFGQDEPMTLTAFSIHKKLVEEEGVDPTSDEYYQEIDRRMRENWPQKFKAKATTDDDADEGKQRQQRPAVGAAGRSAGTSAAAGGKKKIKLSASQVAIAKRLNVPLAEYAKYVAKQDS